MLGYDISKRDSSLTQEDVINQILSSIAMEGLGLRQTISPESGKNQITPRTLKGVSGPERPENRPSYAGEPSALTARGAREAFPKFEIAKGLPGASVSSGAAASSLAIMPFSAHSVILRANGQGKAMDVSQMSFGSASLPAIPVNSDGTITIQGYRQLSFTLPYDSVIQGIYMSAGNNSALYGAETYYPYVELYFAPADSNTFTPIAESITIPEEGISRSALYNAKASGSNTGLDITLSAGTQIIIGAKLKTEHATGERSIDACFSGGIAISSRLTIQGVSS